MNRINRAIELMEQQQPLYMTGAEDLNFQSGVEAAKTWADYIIVDLEHRPFDMNHLDEFMHGLVEGGSTPSGHRTPAVVVTVPASGTSEEVVRANAWMFSQVLDRGVHGILLCHAETPEAVKAFVESVRYPFQSIGVGEGLQEGRRGAGGQHTAAGVWGVSVDEYLERADVWPLNPRGEIMLGLKIENKRALVNAEASTSVPGISFAEWGPGDMGMSFGYPSRHDAPYPQDMLEARSRVLNACKSAGISFANTVTPDDVVEMIREGVVIGGGPQCQEAAEIGRKYTKRTMP